MSALLQSMNRVEQPRMLPPCEPRLQGAWIGEQPTQQPKPPEHASPFKYIDWKTLNRQFIPGSAFKAIDDAYVIEYRAMMDALNQQIRVLEHPKPMEQVGEFEYTQWERPNQEARQDPPLKELDEVYVFEERTAVAAFIERNRVRGLLLQARDPLITAFGEATVKRLSLIEDDEGFDTLFCLIAVSGDIHEARRALRSFDQRWWLARSGQAAGKLNFDFELV